MVCVPILCTCIVLVQANFCCGKMVVVRFSHTKADTESQFKHLADALHKQYRKEKLDSAKSIITLIAKAGVISASFVAPGMSYALRLFKDEEWGDDWKVFNKPFLNRTLKRLSDQKIIDIVEENGKIIIKLTDKGRNKVIRYSLDDLKISAPSHWDKRWRLVVFDIPKSERHLASVFRSYLKSWGFYKYQNSVYLHAYPCEREVEILVNFVGVQSYAKVMLVEKIDEDKPFRDYFGI